MNKTQSTKLIQMLYAALLFFVPLIVLPITKEAYEHPKLTFVYLVLAMLVFLNTNFKFKWHIAAIFLITIILSVVANLTAIDFYTAIFGYYGRFSGGILSYAAYLLLFYIFIINFSKKDIPIFTSVAMLSSVVVCFYGLLQLLNIVNIEGIRIYSTFGQPNWLALYLGFFIPLALYNFFTSDRKILWLSYLLLLVVVVWFTFSLAGLLGFIVSSIYLLIKLRSGISKKVWLSGIAIFSAVLILSILFSATMRSKVSDALVSLFNPDISSYSLSDAGFIRTSVWVGTLRLYTSNLKTILFGVGPEQFAYRFPEFRPESLNYSSEWDYIINKPHNYYLEVLVEHGIVGFITFAYLIIQLFKRLPTEYQASLLGLLVTLFFGWPTVATEMLFWVILMGVAWARE